MRIKGQTTIELTNVNTGVVKRYEDSNMITNAMQNFLNPFGVFGNYPINDSVVYGNRAYTWMTGGLMLFDKRIEENANRVYMPAGTVMVGNGAMDFSNSGNVTNLGSYNATESGVTTEGNRTTIRYVYDFTTAQANGVISCACLTSKLGGYMGMGNDTSRVRDLRAGLESYQDSCYANSKNPMFTFNSYRCAPYSCLAYPVYEEDAMYIVNPQSVYYASSSYTDQRAQHWSTTHKIKVHKVRAGFKSIGILDGSYIENIKHTWEIDVPQAILTYMGSTKYYTNVFSDPFTRSIYIIFTKDSYDISAGSSCYIMKIDSNMQATAYNFMNNTGKKLYIGENGSSSGYRRVAFDGEYMYAWGYVSGSDYKLYKIKYADSTQVMETTATATSWEEVFALAPNLICFGYDYISSYDYYNGKIYDAVNDTTKYVNGYCNEAKRIIPFADKVGVYIEEDMSSNDVEYKVRKDPRYLATINNLAEAIEKTADTTMKVIYTLTYEV